MIRRARRFAARITASQAALAVVALAFFLRVYRLADRNIWWDEGWTVWLSQHDLGWIALRTASDEHPPLHYWLMHFWNSTAGTDAFAGRFFSLFFAVLTVALLYRIGRHVGGRWLGVIAALLLALARFQIWWSQDIKNYTLSGFFALGSVWFVLQLLSAPLHRWRQWGIWIGYIASITLALYSHYLAALVFFADNLFMLIVLTREWLAGRSPIILLARWCLAQFAVLALFTPWLALYLSNAATWAAAPAFDFGLFLRLAVTVFATGVTTYIENQAATVSILTLLAVIGGLWLLMHGQPRGVTIELKWGAVFALIIVLIPPVLIYVLSLTPAAFFAPKIQARYLLILLPAYILLVALGIRFLARGSRFVGLLALLIVVVAQAFTIRDYYEERVLTDEYATIAQAVNAFAVPGDALVLDTDQEWPTFLYYLDPGREWPWFGVPNGKAVDQETAHRVAAQAAQYHGAWLVSIPDALAKDPKHLVETELAKQWPVQYEQTFGDKKLTLYSDRVHNFKDVPPENYHPLAARNDGFDSRLRLTGLDLPVREVYPGDTIHVVTYWESTDLATINTELWGGDGDSRSLTLNEQASPISIGLHERAQADLVIPPDAKPGEYGVSARALGARQGMAFLGTVQVIPRPPVPENLRVNERTQKLSYRFGDNLVLDGLNLDGGDLRPSGSIPLTLFWHAEKPEANSYTVFVHLLGSQYNPAQDNFLWGQIDRLPVEGRLPTNGWTTGQTIADAYALPILAQAPPGLYKIEVGLYDPEGRRLRIADESGKDVGDSIVVGQVEIK